MQWSVEDENKKMTKSLPITKQMVYNSYLKVTAKDGGAGIDCQSIELFNEDMSANLYKIWNRMTSGSYFPPPVRTVFIPKKQGGQRPLGIPTVSDRIAQGVVKDYPEPSLETIFHPSSFGYRPGRSAHDALVQCQENCKVYDWVIDVDIRGFFDNLNHELLMKLMKEHTQDKWVLMYVERWLKAGIEQQDGTIAARMKGTPQGGVISPLLANVYLHHGFDQWMEATYAANPFERYADDIVIHCRSKEEAEHLLAALDQRLQDYALTLHPEKTKVVYCKNYRRKDKHEHESFTFLGYSFQPRRKRDSSAKGYRTYMIFTGAISSKAKASIREAIRAVLHPRWSVQTVEWFAEKLNPKMRGWINYYSRFYRYRTLQVFHYVNEKLRTWIKNKYKLQSKKEVMVKYKTIQQANPTLFYHWQLGIKW
jgi:RNA-directed DNA polymerase